MIEQQINPADKVLNTVLKFIVTTLLVILVLIPIGAVAHLLGLT